MTTSLADRWLDLEGTANTRDLGGLPVAGGGHVRSGVLLRSDNLQDLTEEDVRRLLALPLTAVVDVRTDAERRGTGPSPLAGRVAHHDISLIDEGREVEGDPASVLPDRWSDGAAGAYLHYLVDVPGAAARAVSAVARADGAAVVHCAAGKDRTGTVCALALSAVGVPSAAIVDDYAATNERIEGVYDRLVAAPTYREDVQRIGLDAHRVDPAAMTAVLAAVDERWGGAAAYLLGAGLPQSDLDRLRARLVSG